MRVGILGSGQIGSALSLKLSASGNNVKVANSRGPETIEANVLAFGARAVSTAEAAKGAEVLIVSIPLHRIPDIALLVEGLPAETIVIDTSNYHPPRDGNISPIEAGQPESLWVADQLGRPVVKAWNSVLAGTIQMKGVPSGTPGRIASPVAGDSDKAKNVAMKLVDETGLEPFDAGSLADSWRQQSGQPVYCTEYTIEQMAPALAAADHRGASKRRDLAFERVMSDMGDGKPFSWDNVVEIQRAIHR